MSSSLTEYIIRTLDAVGMGDIRRKVLSAIVQLANNNTLKETSLIKELALAIEMHNEAKACGQSIIDNVAQYDMFKDKNIDVPTMAVAVMFEGICFKKWLQNYNSNVGQSEIFGGVRTKENISDETLKNKINNYEQIRRNLKNNAPDGKKEIGSDDNNADGKNGADKKETNFAVSNTKSKSELTQVQQIIDYISKGLKTNIFAPFSEFQSKLKELGYSSLQAMYNAIVNNGAANIASAKESFNKAKELKDKKVDNEEIFKQTGWYIDSLDGKWRYELPSDAKYKRPNKMAELKNSLGILKLKDVLDYPSLYEAYPQLKNIKITFINIKDKEIKGAYSVDTKEIFLNNENNENENYETIRHEVQHYIQMQEGFAIGASAEREGIQRVEREIDTRRSRLNEYNRIYAALQKVSTSTNKIIGRYEELRTNIKNEEEKIAVKAEIEKLTTEIADFENNKVAYSNYYYEAYAGEIEARAIENRLDNKEREKGSPNKSKDKFREKDITVQFLKTPTGKVLGFVSDGKIYLNPQAVTPTTVWHELVHIQQQVIRVAATKGDAAAKAILSRWQSVVKENNLRGQLGKFKTVSKNNTLTQFSMQVNGETKKLSQ